MDYSYIPVGLKSVKRDSYSGNPKHIDYFIFSKNAQINAHEERNLMVENAYYTNAYGTVPKNELDTSIVLFGFDFTDKYIEISLEDSLIKDSVYEFNFKYFLAQSSSKFIENLGIEFMDKSTIYCCEATEIGYNESKVVISSNEQYFKLAQTKDHDKWFTAAIKYKAKGGERFIIIGRNKLKFKFNKSMSFDYLNQYSNSQNIKERYKATYKKSAFYFFKEFNLVGATRNEEKQFTTAIVYGTDFNSYSPATFKEIKKFCLNQEYKIEGVYFNDSLINMQKSIKALNNLRILILYRFNSSIIKFIYKTNEIGKQRALKKLNELKNYYSSEFNISASRIMLEVNVDPTNIINDTTLYFEIQSF